MRGADREQTASTDDARSATGRLPERADELPRDQAREIQRGRLLAAAVNAVEDAGYTRMTVAQIVARARVSRKTFYGLFADSEDCFLAAFDQLIGEATLVARDAFERESDWRDGIRSALTRLLTLIDDEPGVPRGYA
jgi:AcrR family transcriptional regulator